MNTTETPCRCTSTDREDDSSDCPRHAIDEPLILSLACFWDGPDA
jgi:hypothetical protein